MQTRANDNADLAIRRTVSIAALLVLLWLTSALPAVADPGPVPVEALPVSAFVNGITHTYQHWNNCGPATTSMALSAAGIQVPQTRIQAVLKPDIKDANVSPHEVVAYLRDRGVPTTARVNGRIERLMQFVASGIPVMVETWIDVKGGMGHYRLIRGYDRQARVFLAHDSYFGPDIRLPFDEFDRGWVVFNRLYIPIYRAEQAALVAEILGPDADDAAMWAAALADAEGRVAAAPGDAIAWYALGDDRLATGNTPGAAEAYARAIDIGLPWRFFWYQFGPFEARLALRQYKSVLDLAAPTLARMPNIEELHFYRGQALLGLGRPDQAAVEFRLAVKYNSHFNRAVTAVAHLPAPVGRSTPAPPPVVRHSKYAVPE